MGINVENNMTYKAIVKKNNALIMDACPMTRNGLRHILNSIVFNNTEIMLLSKASDIPMAMIAHSPSVIVMDLCGKDESVLEGLRVIASCQSKWPITPVVVCTTLIDAHFLHQVKALNVCSICYKYDSLQAIEQCIRFAMSGSYKDSPTIQQLFNDNRDCLAMLSNKEIDVLAQVLAGSSVGNTALKMHRDIRTISTQKRSAMGKLGYRNNNDLFTRGQWMVPNGLFNAPDMNDI
ncbi:hypothetical protein [Serratia quinivorans]|uniref:hypothetical protein n=1 Tax=Serratia quinivorans TaxID=137545 RepID=UPI003F9A5E9E